MPITVTKRILSGSTHGAPITISATQGTTPVTVHQLSTSATGTLDEVYLYAHNESGSSTVELLLEIGGSATNARVTTQILPKNGVEIVLPGLLLTGSACAINALVGLPGGAAASAVASAGLLTVYGYVNRIVQS